MVRLPVAVKEDAVDATYEKSILKITMPKTETKPVPKVKVKVKEKK
ncbi:MAG: Hsp20/alpha crystallin family protein [Patescibacteria group bacterium]